MSMWKWACLFVVGRGVCACESDAKKSLLQQLPGHEELLKQVPSDWYS